MDFHILRERSLMSMPSKILKRSPLSLSDEDLAWLGAITANWAFGEQSVEMLIFILARVDLLDGQKFLAKRVGFDQKIADAKKLIKMRLSASPLHEEIGRALMIRGKELSGKRKRTAHWISQSHQPDAGALSFTDLANSVKSLEPDVKKEIFSQLEMQELVQDLADWSIEVFRFIPMCFLSGPLSSRTTWHGPGSGGLALRWEDFRTIQKIRRSQTKT
jgi:hypothetical protein